MTKFSLNKQVENAKENPEIDSVLNKYLTLKPDGHLLTKKRLKNN